jgi:hypothetical protein
MDQYPHGCDYVWLAVDAAGSVAIFTNAGQGPIPAVVLADRFELRFDETHSIAVAEHFE